jgi:predicted dinucleotide-utilizing enzyme
MAVEIERCDQSPPERSGATGGVDCETALRVGSAKEVNAASNPATTTDRLTTDRMR